MDGLGPENNKWLFDCAIFWWFLYGDGGKEKIQKAKYMILMIALKSL